MKAWLIPIASLGAVLASPAAAQDRDCTDDRGGARCTDAAQAEQHALYDVTSAESLAADKTQVMRAFFVDGYGRDAGLVSIVRGPASEPRAIWRSPRHAGSATPGPILSAVVPVATWDKLQTAGRNFDRDLVPLPDNGWPNICLHAWMVRAEIVDADGKVRRKVEGACGDGLAVRYAFELAAAAIEAMPSCALLDSEHTRNDVTRLAECTMLAGDRAAAAQAFNAYRTPWFANPRGPDFARSLQYLFHEQATLTLPGQPPASGGEAASLLWATHAATSPFRPTRIFGESADRVRIEGMITLPGPAGAEREQVPATMLWTRENGFGFRLKSLTTNTN